MRNASDPEADSAASISEGVPWRVVGVRALPGHRIAVRFADGTSGTVDVSGLVFGSRAGVFAQLRDPVLFAAVGIDHGAVTWPGELDLAPDAMYAEIRAHGHWTPA